MIGSHYSINQGPGIRHLRQLSQQNKHWGTNLSANLTKPNFIPSNSSQYTTLLSKHPQQYWCQAMSSTQRGTASKAAGESLWQTTWVWILLCWPWAVWLLFHLHSSVSLFEKMGLLIGPTIMIMKMEWVNTGGYPWQCYAHSVACDNPNNNPLNTVFHRHSCSVSKMSHLHIQSQKKRTVKDNDRLRRKKQKETWQGPIKSLLYSLS